MGRKRQEKALEQALTRALATGIKLGQQQAFERTLISTAESVLHREFTDISGVVAAQGSQEALRIASIAARDLWPGRWRSALEPILGAYAGAVTEGKGLPSFSLANPRMHDWLDGYVSELSETLPKTSYSNFERTLTEALDNGLSVPDTAKLLQERIADLSRNRATLIAQNELHRSSIEATDLQVRESGVPIRARIWRTARDSRVRPEHRLLEGAETSMTEPWIGGLTPGTEVRCRCYIEYAINHDKLAEITSGRVA